jgi:hypothetical protein
MNIVIGGHFRLKVAKELGMVEVPVIYLDLDIEREKELNLRLNQNTGEWDFELLKDLDLSLLLDVGFDNSELSSIWDDMLGVEEDGFDIEKALEIDHHSYEQNSEISTHFGEHRIMCGDSTNEEDVRNSSRQSLLIQAYPCSTMTLRIISDSITPRDSVMEKVMVERKQMIRKSKEDYFLFLEKALHNGLRYAEKDTHVFMWCDPNMIGLIQSLYESLGILPRRVCLWIKNNMNATPNVAFNRAFEPCVYGTKWKPSLSTEFRNLHEVLDKEVWVGNRVLEDIIDLFDIWLAKRLSVGEYEHPTEKPPTLHEKPLKRCTKVWDTVLDLFGWSGSTLIACEQIKRRAVLMEHEPIFIDLIIKRYEQLTGNTARKLN